MTEKELHEKIAKLIFYEHHPITDTFRDYWGITGTMDDESWRRLERHCFYSAGNILALFKEAGYKSTEEVADILQRLVEALKEAGYVQLAEDQSLPTNPVLRNTSYEWRTGYYRAQQDMLETGWRKVKLEE